MIEISIFESELDESEYDSDEDSKTVDYQLDPEVVRALEEQKAKKEALEANSEPFDMDSKTPAVEEVSAPTEERVLPPLPRNDPRQSQEKKEESVPSSQSTPEEVEEEVVSQAEAEVEAELTEEVVQQADISTERPPVPMP